MSGSTNQKIGITYRESQANRHASPAPTGPDILVVMFDDLGFSDLGCFGSEIRTPNIDALAASGHRHNNFHTTTLCAPSRSCLLSGRNHHAAGMRMLTGARYDWPSGMERVSKRAALFSEVLVQAGWNTFAGGKWHLLPQDHQGPSGPYDHWPLGRGFNRFYGFLGGAANHYYPELVQDNHYIEPPKSPEEGYHLTADLIEKTCGFVSDHLAHRAENPLLLYLPLGAPHAPHHAPRDYMERVRGRYDAGWDTLRKERYERQLELGIIPKGTNLPPSNPDVQPWSDLTPNEQKIAARFQEAYAAFIEHTDAMLGKLIAHLKKVGRWDNTLVLLTSDNGAAMDGGELGIMSRSHFFNGIPIDADVMVNDLDIVGGPQADSQYARGWAQASNTPLKWYKRYTHGGGIR
ncbi:MAG: sulfatase-like hydrolase/transferase, partial [Roseovarius sp.]